MHANLHLKLTGYQVPVIDVEKKSVWARLLWILTSLRKRFEFNADGIFADPKWPHLWS